MKQPPDVTLKPRGRRAKCRGSNLVALVSMGCRDGQWNHPEIRIVIPRADGDVWGRDGVTLTFQQNDGREPQYFRPAAGGFLATPSYSEAYARRIEACTEYISERELASRVLDLLDRADRAIEHWRGRRAAGCQLLRTVIGLQRCGVEIRVWNATLRNQRGALRTMQEAA